MPGNIKMKSRIKGGIVMIVLLFAAAYLGYLYRDRKAAFEAYDESLLKLGSDIYMLDAIEAEKSLEVKKMLAAIIEGNAAEMIRLHKQYGFSKRDYGRCVVTKKLRLLYNRKFILNVSSNGRHPDYPLSEVVDYLNSTCEGQPSHENWTDINN